jgi:hypothetical protein
VVQLAVGQLPISRITLADAIQISCVISIILAALQTDLVHIAMLLVAQFMSVSIGWINSIVSTCQSEIAPAAQAAA